MRAILALATVCPLLALVGCGSSGTVAETARSERMTKVCDLVIENIDPRQMPPEAEGDFISACQRPLLSMGKSTRHGKPLTTTDCETELPSWGTRLPRAAATELREACWPLFAQTTRVGSSGPPALKALCELVFENIDAASAFPPEAQRQLGRVCRPVLFGEG